ncbi:Pectin lyase fold containing protein [Parasponia andersonii]|uniref:Pectin lyase fold containing protein n=1 Tax=Parasponia andersonii TaxID=3476 RepID=A0A2P5AKZ4_PARAD|nr:Pectin lyase fold containing protein [Parasponia andersonii]
MSLKLHFLSLITIFSYIPVFLDPKVIKHFWAKTTYGTHNSVAFSTLLLPIFSNPSSSSSSTAPHVLNVDDFGAKADGTYDNQAFGKAWEQACFSNNHQLLF